MTDFRIMTNAILIAALAGVLLQQTVAQPTTRAKVNDEQVIRISASNFDFKPNELTSTPMANRAFLKT